MQVVCESAVCTDSKVRVTSLECLVKIASLYYDKLSPYMQKIFSVGSELFLPLLILQRLLWNLLRRMKRLLLCKLLNFGQPFVMKKFTSRKRPKK